MRLILVAIFQVGVFLVPYLESESHMRDKVKIVLDLSNYATKKALEHATGVDSSDLAPEEILLL